MSSFRDHLRTKAEKCARVIICLLYEAIVISVWMVATMYFQMLGDWAKEKGAAVFFVDAFKWVSSLVLLLITATHVIQDLVETVKDAVRSSKGPNEPAIP